jgi:hypothetical protein
MASACLVRMGFSNAAAAELTSAAGQDLSTLEEYAELDSDGQTAFRPTNLYIPQSYTTLE